VCQLGNCVSLHWVIYYVAFYLHVDTDIFITIIIIISSSSSSSSCVSYWWSELWDEGVTESLVVQHGAQGSSWKPVGRNCTFHSRPEDFKGSCSPWPTRAVSVHWYNWQSHHLTRDFTQGLFLLRKISYQSCSAISYSDLFDVPWYELHLQIQSHESSVFGAA